MPEHAVSISIPINPAILSLLKETREEFTADVLFFMALMLYRRKKLSLGKAAELAGYNKLGFIEKMKTDDEYIFDYTTAELNEIIQDARILP